MRTRMLVLQLVCVALLVAALALPAAAELQKIWYNTSSGQWVTDTMSADGYNAIAKRTTSYNSVFAARDGRLDIVQWDNAGGEYGWHAHQLNTNTYSALTNDSTLQYAYAARSDGLDLLYSSSVWNTVQLNTNVYSGLTPNAATGASLFGARVGSLDLIQYDSAGGWGWHTYNLTNTTYAAITGDAATAGYVYGAREGGGLDLVKYDSVGGWAWHTYTLNSNSYVSVIADGKTASTIYGARADGGLDLIQYDGIGGEFGWHTYSINSVSYTNIIADANPPASISNMLYGARADGGLDVIYNNGQWNRASISSETFSALAIDGTNGNWVYGITNEVPEPSSLLAFFSGIAGLAGFAVRRSK